MAKKSRKSESTNEQVAALGREDAASEVAGTGSAQESPTLAAGSEEGNAAGELAADTVKTAASDDGDAAAHPEAGNAPQAGELEKQAVQEPLPVDVLAAAAAAAMVFGTHEHDNTALPVSRYGYLHATVIRDAALCAAEFVRTYPDVEAAVIPVHLKIKGFRRDEPVSPRELAAWTVFRASLLALDTMRTTEAAEKAAGERAARPKPRPAAPRDGLSFIPQDQAFTPSALTPGR